MYGFKENDYSTTIIEHEDAFRAILNKREIVNENLTLDEIYDLYNKPKRRGDVYILCFEHVEDNIYRFGFSCMGILSGHASSDLWRIEDGKAIHHKNENFIMS